MMTFPKKDNLIYTAYISIQIFRTKEYQSIKENFKSKPISFYIWNIPRSSCEVSQKENICETRYLSKWFFNMTKEYLHVISIACKAKGHQLVQENFPILEISHAQAARHLKMRIFKRWHTGVIWVCNTFSWLYSKFPHVIRIKLKFIQLQYAQLTLLTIQRQ